MSPPPPPPPSEESFIFIEHCFVHPLTCIKACMYLHLNAHTIMHVACTHPPTTTPPHISFPPDECEEVEKEAQALVGIIEDIMGESIQQYF